MGRGDFTLGDLLGESELGLELLAGGEDARLTPIAGAHAIELENPAKWLDRGWMMLTMGVRLRNKPQAQRDLITELRQLGASCLGFGVGQSFKSVPPALLDEARRHGFPVILIPENTQFRDLTRAVFQSTVGVESTTFQRLSSIQQNLIRAFADPHPLESIVQRLGRLVNSTVAVIGLDGTVDAATGAIPVAEIAGRLGDLNSAGVLRLDVDEWHVLTAPATAVIGADARWLVVASKRISVTPELADAAIQVTAPLVGALLRLSVTTRGQDRAIQQCLLDSLIDDGPESQDARALEARVAALGLDFAAEYRAVVVRQRAAGPVRSRTATVSTVDLVASMHTRLDGLGARYLLSSRPNEVVAVVAVGPALSAVSTELVDQWPALTVGIGRAIDSAQHIRASHRDAQIAVQHYAVQSDEHVIDFDDLDVVTQLLAEVPMERLASKVAPITDHLVNNPHQLEALRAYFAANRDIKAAADAIFVHPNTLRYRLERLELALGRSLREPSTTASMYCVLTLLSELAPVSTGHDERTRDRARVTPTSVDETQVGTGA